MEATSWVSHSRETSATTTPRTCRSGPSPKKNGAEQLVIRSEGLFSNIPDIRRVAVATRGGTPIYVADVASVSEGWMPRQGIYSRAYNYDAVEGIVLMRRGENPSRVLARVRAKVG